MKATKRRKPRRVVLSEYNLGDLLSVSPATETPKQAVQVAIDELYTKRIDAMPLQVQFDIPAGTPEFEGYHVLMDTGGCDLSKWAQAVVTEALRTVAAAGRLIRITKS